MGCYTWESIFEAAMVFVVLVYFLDVVSAIAGVGSTLLFVPALVYLAKRFAYYRSQTAQATDSRVRHISEVIDGIASVKSYVWENPFIQLIEKFRAKEEAFIAQSQILRAVNQGLIFSIPSVSSFATFAVFWSRGGQLTIPVIFATLSLLQVLRHSMGRLWTRSIETTSEAIASCSRLDAFLSLVEADERPSPISSSSSSSSSDDDDDVGGGGGGGGGNSRSDVSGGSYEIIPGLLKQPLLDPDLLVEMRHSSFQYNVGDPKPTLTNINMSLKRGELLMVVGPVGCGKSTLLLSLLGEVPSAPRSHTYKAKDVQIAYCAQKPWILADSVRANITIGRGASTSAATTAAGGGASAAATATISAAITGATTSATIIIAAAEQEEVEHQDMYEMAIESCMMVEDLLQWPAYDSTELGERGISISGGQKARISLARAIYADADRTWDSLILL